MRIGHGYDAHRLAAGRRLVLGGVVIPFERGLAAHSDGDVLVHALCDALLGAAGQGDLGQHFPDSREELRDIDSRVLLRRVMAILGPNYRVSNVDLTLVAQAPRIQAFVDTMRANVAADLGIDCTRVNLKATTTEGMGFSGTGEGMEAFAVALLEERR
jgi:2-C-methyl-D-erythritol 2,4-cyclodiphosphate synthase